MKDNEITMFDKAIIAIVPFTIILSVILFFVTKNNNAEIKSIVIGALVSMVLNYWNYKTTLKIGREDYRKLKLFTTISFIARYLLMGILIFVACFFSDYNAIYIVFGILEYPLFLVIFGLLEGKGGREKND